MYETLRIVEKVKPTIVIWENVKGVLTKKHKHNFDAYQEAMEALGYRNYYQVLNAKDYGVPQNRERVFTVSINENHLNEYDDFEMPSPKPLELRLKDILEQVVDEKYYLSERAIEGRRKSHYAKYNLEKSMLDRDGVHPTILARYEGAPSLIQESLEHRIRKLTPKECWRLMGFADEDFEKASKVNSNTQLYKQAGNSIVVNVLEAIFSNLFK